MNQYENFHVVNHPLIQHKLSLIREETTGHKIFRELVTEVAILLAFELTRDFKTASNPLYLVNTGANYWGDLIYPLQPF